MRTAFALPAAAISFLVSSAPAFADLKLCNRMSYVIEAAIGIDDKAATATRGWFRIDPAACRVVVQGTLTADRILLNARALGVYGSSPIPQNGADTLCIAPDNFVIAAARQCRAGQTPAPFTEIRPTCTEITLAIHYKIKNRLFAWLDRHLHFVDTFVNAELRSIRAHFEGIATSYVERMPIMPVFETAAAA